MTEYLSGETLAQRIERSGPWSLDHALLVLRGVLEALREIHAAGLAHGGVAPGNVILRTTGPCISGARAPVSDIRCDLAPAMPIPAGRNDEASTTLIDGPPGDLQAAARLFSFMRNSTGAGPGWVSRLRHRLAQTAPDSFRTAGEALDYLRDREERLVSMAGRLGNCERVRVPNLLECLYIVPSTVCNLKCRFCAYPKSSIARQVMPAGLFAVIVDKACTYGFSTFGLTPLVGEALLDPLFFDKLDLLEQHPGVTGYSFCTNFTVASPDFLNRLPGLRKLTWMSVSIYGHDEESFHRITASPERLFHRVLDNLEQLSEWSAIASHVELRVRTNASFEPGQCHPRFRDILARLASRNVRIRFPNDRFSNWGGLITAEDLVGLDIRLKLEPTKENVPCAFLFYKHTVLPDGRLNACYADDGNATMVIGDLSRQSFEDIYSLRNRAYMELILSHCEQRWSPACRACTGYRGISDEHYSYAFHRKPFLTVPEFLDTLD